MRLTRNRCNWIYQIQYLLSKTISRGKEPISLTVDGRVSTSTDCIHHPVSVIVVYHVEVSMPAPEITPNIPNSKKPILTGSLTKYNTRKPKIYFHEKIEILGEAPRHSLYKTLPKMVECNGHLHHFVSRERIRVPQQNNLHYHLYSAFQRTTKKITQNFLHSYSFKLMKLHLQQAKDPRHYNVR